MQSRSPPRKHSMHFRQTVHMRTKSLPHTAHSFLPPPTCGRNLNSCGHSPRVSRRLLLLPSPPSSSDEKMGASCAEGSASDTRTLSFGPPWDDDDAFFKPPRRRGAGAVAMAGAAGA